MAKNGVFILGILLFLFSVYWIPRNTFPVTVQVQPTQVSTQVPVQPTVQVQQIQTPTIPSEIQLIVAQDYTDTLKNVYAPPIRYRETEYRQLGYLTAPGRDRLPLFGRVLNRRDKWTYYTLEQGIKLPIEYNNRLCTQSPGCDAFSSGDMVKVEGSPYKVTLYESFLSAY
jgi:hypothetical protein